MSLAYEIVPDTPAADALEAIREQRRAFREHAQTLFADLGLEGSQVHIGADGRIVGFYVERPEGWADSKAGGFFPRRSKKNAALITRIGEVRDVTGFDLNAVFFGSRWLDVGTTSYFAGLREGAGRSFVVVPEGAAPVLKPVDGLKPVLMQDVLEATEA